MPDTPAAVPRAPHTPGHRAHALTPPRREIRVPLAPGDTRALAPLRHRAATVLADWNTAPDRVDDVLLVLCELATNALIHTGDAIEVRLRHTGAAIMLEVTDTSPRLPDFHAGPNGSTVRHGYGLKLIVTTLADTVTVTEHPRGGKTITATFTTRTGAEVTGPATRA